jgi:hypothetical protein
VSSEKKFAGTLFGLGEVERRRLAQETAEKRATTGTMRLPSSPVPPAAQPAAPDPLGGTVRLGSEDGGQLRAQLEAAIRARTEMAPQVRMPSTRAPTLMGTGPLQEPESHVPTRKGQGQPPLPETATQSLVPTLKGRGQPPLPETATQSLVPTLKGRGQPPLPETAAQSLVPTLKGQGQPPPTAEVTSPMGESEAPSVPVTTDLTDEQPPVPSPTHVKTLMSPGGPTPEPAAEPLDPTRAPPAPGSVAPSVQPQPAAAVQPQPATAPSIPPQPATYSSSPPPAVLSHAPAELASPKQRGGAVALVAVLGLLFVFGLVGVGVVGYGYYRYSASATAERGAVPGGESGKTTDRDRAEGEKPRSNGSRTTQSFAPSGEGSETAPAAGSANADSSDTGVASDTTDSDGAAGSDESAVQLECTPGCDQMTVVVCDGKKLSLVNGGLKLEPGKHVCMFQATGYAVRQYEFEVKQGETLERSVILTPRRAPVQPAPAEADPQSCGTFINRCKQ